MTIGTLNEGPLHANLKAWYAQPGDAQEVPIEGRWIDLVRDELLVEIQTGSLGALKTKVRALLEAHPVRVVHPVAAETWIVREGAEGTVLGRRKSPKRGSVWDAFYELVSLPRLLLHPGFELELVLIQEEQVRRHAPGRARRRKGWVVAERRLLDVLERRLLRGPEDLLALLPPELPRPFTTKDLARELGITRCLAQKVAYCLRAVGAIEATGRGRAGIRYERAA